MDRQTETDSAGEALTGADSLLRTLVACGVEVCFTNPGTSEMHVVAALDREPRMRGILGLFEGVVTGAADGYARMTGKPACTLLHLGPGLGNGLACLHNARRARVPIVNLVGDHATFHRKLDAPLTSDIESIAGVVSGWVHDTPDARSVAGDAARAVQASYGPPGRIATLILPADATWDPGGPPATPLSVPRPEAPPVERVEDVARRLSGAGSRAALLLNGAALSSEGLAWAGRVAQATGARLLANPFVTRMARGPGRVHAPKVPFPADQARELLADLDCLVTVGAGPPVAFFAYPGKRGELLPESCDVLPLAEPSEDGVAALEDLASALDARSLTPPVSERRATPAPEGELTLDSIARGLAHLLPDDAILMNEAATSGRRIPGWLTEAAPHDWLDLTGGAIGHGLPAATGAAVACPDRKVIALQADGSGMYTLQALWTQAREGLDVTTVLFSNRRYAILEGEFLRVGAGEPSPRARDLLELQRPELDWVRLAGGMGVPARRVDTADAFVRELGRGIAEPGPFLIEAVI